MQIFIRLLAAALLVMGLSLGSMALFTLLDPQVTAQQRRGALAALVLFSLPASAAGSWLIWRIWNQDRSQERNRLHNIFCQLLKQNAGRITVLSFALETGLSGDQAKATLDAYAEEFGATFSMDDSGAIYDQFLG